MALQRCIWSCLANSPGATSPKYHACVERNCNETQEQPAEPIQRGQRGHWSIYKLSIDEPPYYDGYAANTESRNGKLALSYVCGKGGDRYISMAGRRIDRLALDWADPKPVTFSFDGHPPLTLEMGEYEGALITDMLSRDALLISLLQSANRLNVRFARQFETFSLKGSSWAMKIALDYCR
ncbi:hypothetical protein FDK21_08040 [Cohaesibacter sp. CAU 1516]|uniref:hypothetical protein n=1 Tax=Cohaesibacter sp. CAU 1516 TaxID=2576038 RepID=UPI0010FD880F|nr:hypothetical protein [Cohaesibacter sp. CAU 1516]TLP46954.1 hypothetical protein FDK21_08040 [Cohaesibacter sp. CAU 1516]